MSRLSDWWRGWSDADMASALIKCAAPNPMPGAMIRLTRREWTAYVHWTCQLIIAPSAEPIIDITPLAIARGWR